MHSVHGWVSPPLCYPVLLSTQLHADSVKECPVHWAALASVVQETSQAFQLHRALLATAHTTQPPSLPSNPDPPQPPVPPYAMCPSFHLTNSGGSTATHAPTAATHNPYQPSAPPSASSLPGGAAWEGTVLPSWGHSAGSTAFTHEPMHSMGEEGWASAPLPRCIDSGSFPMRMDLCVESFQGTQLQLHNTQSHNSAQPPPRAPAPPTVDWSLLEQSDVQSQVGSPCILTFSFLFVWLPA